MAQIKEVTVRMSAKLFSKLGRLADEVYESRETYIESALAHLVRQVTASEMHVEEVEEAEELDAAEVRGEGFYV